MRGYRNDIFWRTLTTDRRPAIFSGTVRIGTVCPYKIHFSFFGQTIGIGMQEKGDT